MTRPYDVVIEKDAETGQYYGSVPALPGCYSYADTVEELLENMKEAISLHLETLVKKKVKVDVESVIGMVKVVV
ncbi:MAG: type II toxin-antitoxin system HicB family antitoxin [Candidatus Diapherotrites archaeon]